VIDVATERSLHAVIGAIAAASERVELVVLDFGRPEVAGHYAGEVVAIDGRDYVHRPLRLWVDLASRLGFRIGAVERAQSPTLRLVLERLARRDRARGVVGSERYGAGSERQRARKREDPDFVIDLGDALARIDLPAAPRVLDLGCNDGDLFALFGALRPDLAPVFVGVDHSASAIARARFPAATFLEADLDHDLELGEFDLVVSIATLGSTSIDSPALLRRIVQRYLAPRGAVLLGLANCRYRDCEVEYGGRVTNREEPELGVVVKEAAFYRRYLAQHHREVFVTGKYYIFVLATSPSTSGR
jgi:trans-aconitate methyltransferase